MDAAFRLPGFHIPDQGLDFHGHIVAQDRILPFYDGAVPECDRVGRYSIEKGNFNASFCTLDESCAVGFAVDGAFGESRVSAGERQIRGKIFFDPVADFKGGFTSMISSRQRPRINPSA